MKNLSLLVLLLCPLFFQSCFKDRCTREVTHVKTTPVYKTLSEIRADIQFEAARELQKPGKIYYYDNYLFINEQREGVHIFDNENPEQPIPIGFLSIPGNVDIAIRNNTLYADNYIDLLSISINDLENPVLLKRVEDAFPHFGTNGDQILVYYEHEEITEEVDCSSSNRNDDLFQAESIANNSNFSSGQGGSLARFSIYGSHLYTIDHSNLHVFDIALRESPIKINTVGVGWEIETLFSYTDKLFIGSTTGMIIMDASTPIEPTYLSQYAHAYACDPVFVKAPYAYVTLREGQECFTVNNQLDLVDISDLSNPVLQESFPMDNPHGLSIKDNTLFICEGDKGLKSFDISNPLELDKNQLSHIKNIHSFDIIALPGNGNVLLVIGEDGLYQYDGTDPQNLRLLSKIAVKK